MKNKACLILVLLILCLPSGILCQFISIENAKQNFYTSNTDEERLASLVEIGKFRNSLHGDTIYYYAQLAKKLALTLNDTKNLAWAEYSLLCSDLANGKTDSVLYKINNNPSFKNIKKINTSLYYKIQLLKANALNRTNNRTAALDLQLKLLDEAEKEGNINAQLFALNFIGATYLNVNKAEEAMQTWQRGLKIIKDKNDSDNKEIEAYLFSNVALYYFNKFYTNQTNKLSDSFFTAINQTIILSKQSENFGVLASALSIRGNFYGLIKQFEAGEKDIQEGLQIRKEIGDPLYIINDCISLSNFYLNQKKYKNCIESAKDGIEIAYKNGIKGTEVLSLFANMGNAYKSLGDYKEYSQTLEQFITVADSSQQINSAEKIADIQTKYEVQKKETLIAQQKLDLLQRNLFIYGSTVVIILFLIFLVYRFKRYQRQQKVKVVAMMEEKRQQQDTAIKDAEENERKRIAAELHDNLGVQANAILHSSNLLKDDDNKIIVADLQDTAKEMLYNLRETLWAMKTADVPAKDLWLRIINFMKQMGRHYTNINFKIEGIAPSSLIIPSSQALHIVLVLQESVNNSVKHASANTISVSSILDSNSWLIKITDDGKGFNLDSIEIKTDHYGMTNMKQRAKEGNFNFKIESSINNGTSSTLQIGI